MPTALETLVKILKLERSKGYRNNAVQGGLSQFTANWNPEAHRQARVPDQHVMIDEITDRLRRYDDMVNTNERQAAVTYVLQRAMQPMAASKAPEGAEAGAPPTLDKQELPTRHPRGEKPPRTKKSRDSEEPAAVGAGEKEAQRARKEKVRTPQEARPQRTSPARGPDRRESSGDESSALDYDYVGETRTPGRRDIPLQPRLARPPRRPRQPMSLDQASDVIRGLNAPVNKLRGIGEMVEQRLERVGIRTINDLLNYLPRRYDDYTALLPIARLGPNMQATVIGNVRSTEIRVGQGARKDLQIVLDDGTRPLLVTFFGQHYLLSQIRPHMQLVLRGVTSIFRNQLQMANPEWEFLDPEDLQLARIIPIYPLTEGLRPKKLRSIIQQALDYWADRVPDYIPEATLERTELADLGWALRNIHMPESWDHLQHAKRRYVFDELLISQLAILGNRLAWQSVPSEQIETDSEWLESFVTAVFPYTLTGAQRRAVEDIRVDIGKAVPMNRLIQGDVGSGKTAVAITALAMAFHAGKQAALMAPTSILAEQHYRGISRALAKMPGERQPTVALLTGSISAAEREQIRSGLADGSIDVVVGTHAVIQEGVEFANLALAIIDEQHRFGVEQRGALRGKGTNPHLLVMTATPIPRTLALTVHADLDLTVIDELPPGRIPIQTRVINPNLRERAYELIEGQLELGRQAFIVYPLVEASESVEAKAATDAYVELQKVFFRHKVGLLHGKMRPAEKDAIMADFSEHKFDVMVTTSVAEVGVDIPNASIIMIDGANRFGLAQLHQFRGRVGRGGHASYCILVCDTEVKEARDRLTAMEMFSDGFKLAEIDWKLRGAGDLIGTRQSGHSTLQLLEDMSPDLVAVAQREARTLFEEDPTLSIEEHRLIAQRVRLLNGDPGDIS